MRAARPRLCDPGPPAYPAGPLPEWRCGWGGSGGGGAATPRATSDPAGDAGPAVSAQLGAPGALRRGGEDSAPPRPRRGPVQPPRSAATRGDRPPSCGRVVRGPRRSRPRGGGAGPSRRAGRGAWTMFASWARWVRAGRVLSWGPAQQSVPSPPVWHPRPSRPSARRPGLRLRRNPFRRRDAGGRRVPRGSPPSGNETGASFPFFFLSFFWVTVMSTQRNCFSATEKPPNIDSYHCRIQYFKIHEREG